MEVGVVAMDVIFVVFTILLSERYAFMEAKKRTQRKRILQGLK